MNYENEIKPRYALLNETIYDICINLIMQWKIMQENNEEIWAQTRMNCNNIPVIALHFSLEGQCYEIHQFLYRLNSLITRLKQYANISKLYIHQSNNIKQIIKRTFLSFLLRLCSKGTIFYTGIFSVYHERYTYLVLFFLNHKRDALNLVLIFRDQKMIDVLFSFVVVFIYSRRHHHIQVTEFE